jgi:hypothetical protein
VSAAALRIAGVSFYWERKVLEEKIETIRQHCQDALEDAVLMGCDEQQLRSVLQDLITKLENPYGENAGRALRTVLSL